LLLLLPAMKLVHLKLHTGKRPVLVRETKQVESSLHSHDAARALRGPILHRASCLREEVLGEEVESAE
jgi:hypothetical protein